MPSATLPLPPPVPTRPRRPAPRLVAPGAVAVTAVLAVAASYAGAVLDPTGRRLDDAAMATAMRLGAGARSTMLTLLDVVAVPTVALAVLALVGVALARGRTRHAAGIVALVLGSQVVAQVLKDVLPRPGDAAGNSLPSGHVTLVVALGVALLIAVPRVLRPLGALVATGATGLVGLATMVAGWHRPSDLVAAVAVVAGVAALLALVDAERSGRGQTISVGARASTTCST